MTETEKYIQVTKAGRFAVVFPESIKTPRRLGVYDTIDEASAARDAYLSRGDEQDDDTGLYPVLRGEGSTIVGLYDPHCPYQDEKATDRAKRVIEIVKPDAIAWGGDLLDFYKLSSFLQDETRAHTVQDEIDAWVKLSGDVRDCAPQAKVYAIVGNHDLRLYRYLCANPELASLDVLKLESLLKLDAIGAELGRAVSFLDNRLVFIHGRYCSKNSGAAVKREIDERAYQQSIIQGHGHKIGRFDKSGPLFNIVGVEVGCLCQNSWYADDRYWQRGCVVVTIDGGKFEVENVNLDVGMFRGQKL